MVLPQTAEYVTDKAVACSGHITATAPVCSVSSDSALDPMTSVAGLFTDAMSMKNSVKSSHDQENFVSVSSGAKGLINIGGTSDSAEVLLDVTENVCSMPALTTVITPGLHSYDKCLHNTNPLPIASAEVSLEVAETVNLVDGPQRPLLLNPTYVEDNPNPEGLHETVSTSRDLCNVESEPSGEEQVHVFSLATMQDKEAETGGYFMSDNDPGNLVAMHLPLMFKSATGKENSVVYETISSSHDFHNGAVIPPSSEEQNQAGVLDKESNIYASLGEDQGNLVSVHSSSFENQIPVSASGKQNVEAQCLTSNSATQVNQQNLVDSAVNGISYQQMPLESSPTADQDQGTDMATSSAAQACINQNTGQPMENPFHDEIEVQPSSEDSDFNQVLQVAMQFYAHRSALSEQTVSQPLTSFSLNQRAHASTNGFDIPFSHTGPTLVTSHLLLPFNCELLQHALERLEREREESLKSHEDKKLQLKSEMEKGIEELKAEICQEYETKFQQIEAEFILKKEDLLAIHKKVLIHMLLACAWDLAFKSNVTDITGSSSSGVHHGGNYTVDRQLVRSYMQQNAQMPSLVSSSSSANPPAACRQSTPLALATIPHYTALLRQNVEFLPTPVHSLTNPASHPRISSFSSLTGGPQGRVEIRAPLQDQPCRPSIPFTGGTSAFSHEEGSSNHQSQRNSLSSSLPELFISQQPTPTQISDPYNMQHDHEIAGEPSLSVTGTGPVYQQCGVISNQQQRTTSPSPPSLPPPTQLPLLLTQQFVPSNMVRHRETMKGLPALRSVSALELLIDMSYPSSRTRRSTQNGSRLESSGGSTDIVCLSDDE
ncbi:hypothetical protein ACLB2K_040574 [Fragaria x ananassa]